MDTAHRGQLVRNAHRVIQRKNNHSGWSRGDGLEDRGDIDWAGGDAELGAPAQGAGQKLRLHAVGIRNEDADGRRSS
jgi:hypothetical protein